MNDLRRTGSKYGRSYRLDYDVAKAVPAGTRPTLIGKVEINQVEMGIYYQWGKHPLPTLFRFNN